MTTIVLTPMSVGFSQLEQVYRDGISPQLDPYCKPAVELAASRIAEAAAGGAAVYGVNTGFGKLASVKVAPEDTAQLQRNLILSHCCGVGEAMPEAHVRLMMTLKLLSFGRGASGVRWALVGLLEGMLRKGVTPEVPAQGSVGASGDLAPLAHMTAAMMGEGKARYQGVLMDAAEALAKAGLEPVELGPKEGPRLYKWDAIFHGLCACGPL